MSPKKPTALRRRDFLALGVTVGATLALAACGGAAAPASNGSPAASSAAKASTAASSGSPTTAAQLASYQGADRQQLLEAGAKEEGQLTWYTSLAGDIIKELTNGFKAKYPFAKLEVFRAAENDLVTRAMQEHQAGKRVMDALETPIDGDLIFNESKLLLPFFSPALAKIPDDFKTAPKDGLAVGATDRITFIGFGYNTTLIPEKAVPKKIEDLLNPELAGKIQLAGTTTGYRWVGSVLHGMGEANGQKFLEQFAKQQKVQVQQVSGKALLDLIAKGEVPGSPTIFKDHVVQAAQKNAPVKWVGISPVVANVGQMSLAAEAPHPHAALLFLDYVLGQDGQAVLAKLHYSLPIDKQNFGYWIPEQGRTAAQVEQDQNSWADNFKKLFR